MTDAKSRYEELFKQENKAKAFDKIAARFFMTNFGQMSKADFEILLFSEYLEQILTVEGEENDEAYSDYTLSKLLGITQSKVSSLKVRKQLQYPHEFVWQNAFARYIERAVYEDGKIKLYIPDKNLFNEVRNAIETRGGYIEMQLNVNLLQVRLGYFLDLLLLVEPDKTRGELTERIRDEIKKQLKDTNIVEAPTFGTVLKDKAPDLIISIISSCVPMFSEPVALVGKSLYRTVSQAIERKRHPD